MDNVNELKDKDSPENEIPEIETQEALSPKAKPGLFELIYGVLFDPVKTFRRMADEPALGSAALIFSLVKILSVLTGVFLSARMMTEGFGGYTGGAIEEVIMAIIPLAAVLGLVYQYIKWFVYSGLLYLLAEISGGRGSATGVLTVTGLASLPALLFLPIQILATALGGDHLSGIINILVLIVVITWGGVLVVIGLRETQQLSTARAVIVALAPGLAIIFMFIILMILIMALLFPLGQFFGEMYNMGF